MLFDALNVAQTSCIFEVDYADNPIQSRRIAQSTRTSTGRSSRRSWVRRCVPMFHCASSSHMSRLFAFGMYEGPPLTFPSGRPRRRTQKTAPKVGTEHGVTGHISSFHVLPVRKVALCLQPHPGINCASRNSTGPLLPLPLPSSLFFQTFYYGFTSRMHAIIRSSDTMSGWRAAHSTVPQSASRKFG